jgi:hypothetical protein
MAPLATITEAAPDRNIYINIIENNDNQRSSNCDLSNTGCNDAVLSNSQFSRNHVTCMLVHHE